MGTDEVLEHCHSFLQVGDDRVFDNVGSGSTCLLRFCHKSTHTAELLDLLGRTTGTGIQHHIYRIEALLVRGNLLAHYAGQVVIHCRPEIHDLVITLLISDETEGIVTLDLLNLLIGVVNKGLFLCRHDNVSQVEGDTGTEGLVVTEVLDIVKELGSTGHTGVFDHIGNDGTQRFLTEQHIHVWHLVRNVLVYNDSTGCSLNHLVTLRKILLVLRKAYLDKGVHIDLLRIIGYDNILRTVEAHSLPLGIRTNLCDIVKSEHHILRRHRNRGTIGRIKNVMRTEHKELGFHNGSISQRKVHGHLVTIEVGVESRTSERMKLNGFTLYHSRLESLDTQSVQGRGTVKQYRMTLHHILEDIPDYWILAVHNLLSGLNRLDDTSLYELADDERLVQLSCHILRQTALVHIKFRTHDDN